MAAILHKDGAVRPQDYYIQFLFNYAQWIPRRIHEKQLWRMTNDRQMGEGCWVMAKAHMAFGEVS
jgi:hypothetical protein